MNIFTLLIVVIEITLNANCRPFPAGQIVKYRVPTKYFNATAAQEGSADSLYSFLSQIHYGGGSSQTVTLNSNAIPSKGDVPNEVVTLTSQATATERVDTNESPEATNSNITNNSINNNVTEQQKDIIKVNVDDNESAFHALIEKVVNDEIKKLAQDQSPVKTNEVIRLNSAPLLNVFIIPSDDDDDESPPALKDKETTIRTTTIIATSMVQEQDGEQTELSATSGTMDLDSETIVPTYAPAVEIVRIKLQTISDDADTTTEVYQKVSDETTTATPTKASSAASAAAIDVAAAVTNVNGIEVDENVNGDENSISNSLLSAVGDLLSSILGLDGSKDEKSDENAIDDENEDENNVDSDSKSVATSETSTAPPTAETFTTTIASDETESESESKASTSDETTGIEQGTERIDETATPVGYEGELNSERESTETTETILPLNLPAAVALNAVHYEDLSEIDLKIENLANMKQTSFATESTPETNEQVTETVSGVSGDDSSPESVKFEPDMLEVIRDPSNERPVLFEESVNQVMNLVKNTADEADGGRVPLGDSYLIDKQTLKDDVNILDDVVYGTLKEIESRLGMNQHEVLSSVHSSGQEDLIRNFEAEINKSLINKHPYPFVTFLPNTAKAALRRYDVDF